MRTTRLSKIVDQVNERFGSTRLYFAPMFEAHDTAPVRIAFTQVPDEADVSMAEMAMR